MKLSSSFLKVKTWQLMLVLAAFLLVAAYSLRQNNLRMGELRDAVVVADEQGEGVEEALNELREHIFSHMNTQLSQPLNLVGSFNRAVEEARLEAQETGANPQVYIDAQRACEDPSVVLSVRAQCIQDFVSENAPEGTDPQELVFPPKELYIYDFRSPSWSPDVAGWSIVVSVVLAGIITGRVILGLTTKNPD